MNDVQRGINDVRWGTADVQRGTNDFLWGTEEVHSHGNRPCQPYSRDFYLVLSARICTR